MEPSSELLEVARAAAKHCTGPFDEAALIEAFERESEYTRRMYEMCVYELFHPDSLWNRLDEIYEQYAAALREQYRARGLDRPCRFLTRRERRAAVLAAVLERGAT
jgi:hypothetical protein